MNEQYLGVNGQMVTVGGKAVKMPQGVGGRDGVTFTPSMSDDGDLSWTNDGGKANPQTVNLKGPKGDTGARGPAGADGAKGDTGPEGPRGPQGEQGPQGQTGPQGETGPRGPAGANGAKGADGAKGATFTPAVSAAGDLSWTNDGGLANPETVNLKGPKGDTGAKGEPGAKGDKGDTGPQGPMGSQGKTGPAGTDGKTPVKGTDYFTPTDVNEIAAEAAKKVDISGKLDKPANDATATEGQLLTKTADGQEWKDSEKNVFVVNMTLNRGESISISSIDKTFDEVCAAYNTGKTVIANVSSTIMHYIFPLVALQTDQVILFTAVSIGNLIAITMTPRDTVIHVIAIQDQIIAKGILKGDGNGGISSATAGTDYVAPNGDASNVTAAFTAASTRANIATGEKLSVLFGKIAKWFADLGSLAFKSTVAKSDLASDVQTSLGKADSALQSVSKSDVGLGNVANERQYSSANPPPYPVTSVNGKTGAVTVESSSGTTYNATLSSSGWTTSGSYKKQTVTVTGLKANYPVAPIVDAQLTGTDADGDTAVLTGFSAINLIQTAENQLIAYCIGDAPTVNIPLIINTWG